MSSNSNYNEVINVSKNANMKLYFPEIKDSNRLKISNVGIYSVSKPMDAEWITQKILENIKNPEKMVITDATAAVGGNTINFSKYFKKVNAIELNKIHYDILINNINVYGYKNINTIFGNSLTEVPKLKQDIIFIDAPWSGTNYKKHKSLRLYMSGKPLPMITNDFLKYADMVVLKVPYNFDFSHFFTNVNMEKFSIYKTLKFRLIILQK